ncbi:MAG: cobalamin-binding protein [Candidatus Hydrogenedentota bacterium]|nr:MAG: cobalamin-binding protein [Candidatus Hydrogenedentota bacterium]
MSRKENDYFPKRIICLTEETTETLYLLGEEERIVGISGFTVRPARARKEKPRVSAFTSANIEKILNLNPDLVLGFSDLQADIAAMLIREGVEVHIFNHRSVEGIFSMVAMLGSMVGASKKAIQWIETQKERLRQISKEMAKYPKKPIVYFEEWDEPIITGIEWVSDLIEMAGGQEAFPELARKKLAKKRIIENPEDVIQRNPDIIIGSWCGKKFRPEKLKSREGWNQIKAVQNNFVFEIKSADILQPGPAAITDGFDQIHKIILEWHRQNSY